MLTIASIYAKSILAVLSDLAVSLNATPLRKSICPDLLTISHDHIYLYCLSVTENAIYADPICLSFLSIYLSYLSGPVYLALIVSMLTFD